MTTATPKDTKPPASLAAEELKPGPVTAPVAVPVTDTPEIVDVPLSEGMGGCYTMIDGKRVRTPV